MAKTPSTMLPLGTPAPDFALTSTEGTEVTLSDFDGFAGLLVMFICNHCPFVKHIRDELSRLGDELVAKGVGVVAIMSNDVANYPDDRPELMRLEKEQANWRFPYLYDSNQSIAKAYQAACTPDFYLFDRGRKLVYRGQLDDSRPGNGIPVTGVDLRNAVDVMLSGSQIDAEQKPSIGCNIKWIPGNEPSWYR